MEPSGLRSEFEEDFQKRRGEMRRKKELLPQELLSHTPLNPNDPAQVFYRQTDKLAENKSMVMKMGWKIAVLSREQEDLALLCFSLLQAELDYPLKIYTITHLPTPQTQANSLAGKHLWMETQMLLSGISRVEEQENLQLSLYRLFLDRLLPLFRNFVASYIDWSVIVQPDFDQDITLHHFEEIVIEPVRLIFKHFKIGQ
jgi:hypothetical protein